MSRLLLLTILAWASWCLFIVCLVGFLATGSRWALLGIPVSFAATIYINVKALDA